MMIRKSVTRIYVPHLILYKKEPVSTKFHAEQRSKKKDLQQARLHAKCHAPEPASNKGPLVEKVAVSTSAPRAARPRLEYLLRLLPRGRPMRLLARGGVYATPTWQPPRVQKFQIA